jgi:hypothetical protein
MEKTLCIEYPLFLAPRGKATMHTIVQRSSQFSRGRAALVFGREVVPVHNRVNYERVTDHERPPSAIA